MLVQLTIAPIFLLLTYIYNCDKYEKEPASMLSKAFLAGFFAVSFLAICGEYLCSLLTSLWLSPAEVNIMNAVLAAPFFEEALKFAFLMLLVWNNVNFNEHFDGIVYAVYISLGFACLENFLYVLSAGEMGLVVSFFRGIFAVPAHFLFAVIMGYYFALAKFHPQHTTRYLTFSLVGAMFSHFCYNGTIVLVVPFLKPEIGIILSYISVVLISIALWIQAVRRIRHLSDLSRNDPPALANAAESKAE